MGMCSVRYQSNQNQQIIRHEFRDAPHQLLHEGLAEISAQRAKNIVSSIVPMLFGFSGNWKSSVSICRPEQFVRPLTMFGISEAEMRRERRVLFAKLFFLTIALAFQVVAVLQYSTTGQNVQGCNYPSRANLLMMALLLTGAVAYDANQLISHCTDWEKLHLAIWDFQETTIVRVEVKHGIPFDRLARFRFMAKIGSLQLTMLLIQAFEEGALYRFFFGVIVVGILRYCPALPTLESHKTVHCPAWPGMWGGIRVQDALAPPADELGLAKVACRSNPSMRVGQLM